MFSCSHCQECGRKLLHAFFCYPCEQTFCSPVCLKAHSARHRPVATRGEADPATLAKAEPTTLAGQTDPPA